MIYGMYLSASGVVANSYRQDVIANNLANAETNGFKRDLPMFRQRLTEAQQRRLSGGGGGNTNAMLEALGGGLLATRTAVDSSQGELEPTHNEKDLAIEGQGYFAVRDAAGNVKLTRDGRFMVDAQGQLSVANGRGERVLDAKGKPIFIDGRLPLGIDQDGSITQAGRTVGQVGVFDVPDRSRLTKSGGTMLSYPGLTSDTGPLAAATAATVRSGFIERANVDPTTELTALMDAQRQLEANANMIRYQDQTLAKLVNEVGKIA